jgi:hypothetical protein
VTINGAYDIWSRHSFLPKFNRRLKGNIVVGKAIDPLDFKSVQDLNDALKENIASNLEDLNNTGWFL